jgi:2-oxoglutarate dehydrogenase E1 component
MDASHPPLSSHSLAFAEGLYADYVADPSSVSAEWRAYFDALPRPAGSNGHLQLGPSFPQRSVFAPRAAGPGAPARASAGPAGAALEREAELAGLQSRVDLLIRSYRVRGHRAAQLDPLGQTGPQPPELDPGFHGLSETDLERVVSAHHLGNGSPAMLPLREIVERLRATYCRSIGVQFMHIDEIAVRAWLQERLEGDGLRVALERAEQLRILERLSAAVIFEDFLQKKFLGAKRFSLEGGESLIPLLDLAIERAAEHGIGEIVFGMAHRGRINVLHNILGKGARQIFREFSDLDPEIHRHRGDVKYHLGHSADWTTASGQRVHLSLCFNPSHLEFVGPVALGRMRAKQDRYGDSEGARGLAILIHGDAAFAGQGVVQETLNLSQLPGYRTGGTMHVIVNNQVGFTTSPEEGRSSTYATDVAKMLQSPIFHVNGEDPEAVAQVVRVALDFRQRFRRDVVIDMYCYRRYGHNEGDEPAFTQPLMYRAIRARKPVREAYLEHLLRLGGVSREEADEIAERARTHLEQELSVARGNGYKLGIEVAGGLWTDYRGGPDGGAHEVDTGLARPELARLLEESTRLPEGFTPHAKIARWLEQRVEMARGALALDWAAGEALACASLVVGGTRVRLSGQDSARGTFSHRHMVLHDAENGAQHCPLARLEGARAPFEVHNSPLSEIGVLGFEYGYSLDWPDALVLWEAQFGDFCNVAQVIIDQFLVSAEEKWRRLSGLVLLLPHGFEGQGPEHSSARLERFLTLASEDNIQVAQPTTPAQMFHLLRRQALRRWRKPLIVMTPKSLLRHARAVSTLDELAQGRFQRVLPDRRERPRATTRVLLCSGKLYYELEEAREQQGRADVAILRLEQLYPLGEQDLGPALADYKANVPVMWVQEEPQNMGAWRSLQARFGERLLARHPFSGLTRPASASPATGSSNSHKIEQRELIEQAFA